MSAVPSIIKKPPPTWALQVPAILAAKPTPVPTWYAETDLWTEPQVLFQGSKLEEVTQRYILCDHVLNFADPAVADVKQLAALTAAATSAKSAAVSGPLSASDALLHAVVDRDSIVFPPPLFQLTFVLPETTTIDRVADQRASNDAWTQWENVDALLRRARADLILSLKALGSVLQATARAVQSGMHPAAARAQFASERRRINYYDAALVAWQSVKSVSEPSAPSPAQASRASTPSRPSIPNVVMLASSSRWSASICGYRTADTRGDKLVLVGCGMAPGQNGQFDMSGVFLVLVERMFYRLKPGNTSPTSPRADSGSQTKVRQWHTARVGFVVHRQTQCVMRLTNDCFKLAWDIASQALTFTLSPISNPITTEMAVARAMHAAAEAEAAAKAAELFLPSPVSIPFEWPLKQTNENVEWVQAQLARVTAAVRAMSADQLISVCDQMFRDARALPKPEVRAESMNDRQASRAAKAAALKAAADAAVKAAMEERARRRAEAEAEARALKVQRQVVVLTNEHASQKQVALPTLITKKVDAVDVAPLITPRAPAPKVEAKGETVLSKPISRASTVVPKPIETSSQSAQPVQPAQSVPVVSQSIEPSRKPANEPRSPRASITVVKPDIPISVKSSASILKSEVTVQSPKHQPISSRPAEAQQSMSPKKVPQNPASIIPAPSMLSQSAAAKVVSSADASNIVHQVGQKQVVSKPVVSAPPSRVPQTSHTPTVAAPQSVKIIPTISLDGDVDQDLEIPLDADEIVAEEPEMTLADAEPSDQHSVEHVEPVRPAQTVIIPPSTRARIARAKAAVRVELLPSAMLDRRFDAPAFAFDSWNSDGDDNDMDGDWWGGRVRLKPRVPKVARIVRPEVPLLPIPTEAPPPVVVSPTLAALFKSLKSSIAPQIKSPKQTRVAFAEPVVPDLALPPTVIVAPTKSAAVSAPVVSAPAASTFASLPPTPATAVQTANIQTSDAQRVAPPAIVTSSSSSSMVTSKLLDSTGVVAASSATPANQTTAIPVVPVVAPSGVPKPAPVAVVDTSSGNVPAPISRDLPVQQQPIAKIAVQSQSLGTSNAPVAPADSKSSTKVEKSKLSPRASKVTTPRSKTKNVDAPAQSTNVPVAPPPPIESVTTVAPEHGTAISAAAVVDGTKIDCQPNQEAVQTQSVPVAQIAVPTHVTAQPVINVPATSNASILNSIASTSIAAVDSNSVIKRPELRLQIPDSEPDKDLSPGSPPAERVTAPFVAESSSAATDSTAISSEATQPAQTAQPVEPEPEYDPDAEVPEVAHSLVSSTFISPVIQSLVPFVINRAFIDYLEVRAATRPLLLPAGGSAAPVPLHTSSSMVKLIAETVPSQSIDVQPTSPVLKSFSQGLSSVLPEKMDSSMLNPMGIASSLNAASLDEDRVFRQVAARKREEAAQAEERSRKLRRKKALIRRQRSSEVGGPPAFNRTLSAGIESPPGLTSPRGLIGSPFSPDAGGEMAEIELLLAQEAQEDAATKDGLRIVRGGSASGWRGGNHWATRGAHLQAEEEATRPSSTSPSTDIQQKAAAAAGPEKKKYDSADALLDAIAQGKQERLRTLLTQHGGPVLHQMVQGTALLTATAQKSSDLRWRDLSTNRASTPESRSRSVVSQHSDTSSVPALSVAGSTSLTPAPPSSSSRPISVARSRRMSHIDSVGGATIVPLTAAALLTSIRDSARGKPLNVRRKSMAESFSRPIAAPANAAVLFDEPLLGRSSGASSPVRFDVRELASADRAPSSVSMVSRAISVHSVNTRASSIATVVSGDEASDLPVRTSTPPSSPPIVEQAPVGPSETPESVPVSSTITETASPVDTRLSREPSSNTARSLQSTPSPTKESLKSVIRPASVIGHLTESKPNVFKPIVHIGPFVSSDSRAITPATVRASSAFAAEVMNKNAQIAVTELDHAVATVTQDFGGIVDDIDPMDHEFLNADHLLEEQGAENTRPRSTAAVEQIKAPIMVAPPPLSLSLTASLLDSYAQLLPRAMRPYAAACLCFGAHVRELFAVSSKAQAQASLRRGILCISVPGLEAAQRHLMRAAELRASHDVTAPLRSARGSLEPGAEVTAVWLSVLQLRRGAQFPPGFHFEDSELHTMSLAMSQYDPAREFLLVVSDLIRPARLNQLPVPSIAESNVAITSRRGRQHHSSHLSHIQFNTDIGAALLRPELETDNITVSTTSNVASRLAAAVRCTCEPCVALRLLEHRQRMTPRPPPTLHAEPDVPRAESVEDVIARRARLAADAHARRVEAERVPIRELKSASDVVARSESADGDEVQPKAPPRPRTAVVRPSTARLSAFVASLPSQLRPATTARVQSAIVHAAKARTHLHAGVQSMKPARARSAKADAASNKM